MISLQKRNLIHSGEHLMSSKQQPRPITGAAVRAYRRLLAMNQADFAAAVGVSQGLISQWESGAVAVGPDSQRRMWEAFAKHPQHPLGKFIDKFAEESRGRAPLASNPKGRSLSLLVYRWREDFTLVAEPNQCDVVGMVTLNLDAMGEAIALEMPAARDKRGDIVAFVRDGDSAPEEPGQWLVQQRRGAGAGQVLVIEVKRGGSSPPRSKVILPSGATYDPSAVEAAFRAVFEGRYL
jgi:DNA-binding transcriptional regulator YiaG